MQLTLSPSSSVVRSFRSVLCIYSYLQLYELVFIATTDAYELPRSPGPFVHKKGKQIVNNDGSEEEQGNGFGWCQGVLYPSEPILLRCRYVREGYRVVVRQDEWENWPHYRDHIHRHTHASHLRNNTRGTGTSATSVGRVAAANSHE